MGIKFDKYKLKTPCLTYFDQTEPEIPCEIDSLSLQKWRDLQQNAPFRYCYCHIDTLPFEKHDPTETKTLKACNIIDDDVIGKYTGQINENTERHGLGRMIL